MRILWLDDEPEMVKFAEECCRYSHRDWIFINTSDPVWAIHMLETQPYDVVVSDVMITNPLPEGWTWEQSPSPQVRQYEGIRLWRRFRYPFSGRRESITPRTVPILIVSAHSHDALDMYIGRYVGPYEILSKPILPDELRLVLEAIDAGRSAPHRRWYDPNGIDGGYMAGGSRPDRDTPPPVRWRRDRHYGPKELEW